jgi:hypothetical protein
MSTIVKWTFINVLFQKTFIKPRNVKFIDFVEFAQINKSNCQTNIIIPYYNRENNLKFTLNYLQKILKKHNDYFITVVEMSEKMTIKDYCNDVNYIWIDLSKHERFNKSLCMNVASDYIESEWYMFYDVDLVSTDDFIEKIESNLKNDCKVLQCFKNRKVIPIYEDKITDILNGNIKIKDLPTDFNFYSDDKTFIPHDAPGGIILINKEVFEKVGGFDDLLFSGWGYEDTLMWKKISLFETIKSANDPEVNVFHLWHEIKGENKNNNNGEFFDTIDNLVFNIFNELVSEFSDIFKKRKKD